MDSRKKKNLKRKLKHQRQQIANQVDSIQRVLKQMDNHLENIGDFLYNYKYQPNIDTPTINHNYQGIIQPMVNALQTNPPKYNEKDNRTLLSKYDYTDTGNGLHWFTGLVMDYRIVQKTNKRPKIYLLLTQIWALLKARGTNKWHPVTDHLWIDINDFRIRVKDDDKAIIGLGDRIEFSANIKTYRGRRENIRQTKYGVNNVSITNYGYPVFTFEPIHTVTIPKISLDLKKFIPYNHHDNYLLKVTKHPTTIEFGNHIRESDRPILADFTDRYCNEKYFDQSYFNQKD